MEISPLVMRAEILAHRAVGMLRATMFSEGGSGAIRCQDVEAPRGVSREELEMDIKAGSRLACPECSVELVVVRPPSSPVALTCGGVEVVDAAADRPGGGHADASGDGTLVGKRYADEDSGIEVLCAKPGPGTLAADGREVPIKGAKPLPSSD